MGKKILDPEWMMIIETKLTFGVRISEVTKNVQRKKWLMLRLEKCGRKYTVHEFGKKLKQIISEGIT